MTKYYLTDLLSQDELMHYGIKGQKWGRRRFQYEDGSLTPAGKERYDDDGPSERKKKEYKIPEKKSVHRMKLEDKYIEKGMSTKEAEQAAARRIRGEQYAVAAAAVTVAACIAYNKYKNYNTDKTLSSNTEFQRIVLGKSENDPVRKGAKYVSYDRKDKIKYQGLLGGTYYRRKEDDQKVFNMTVKSANDIKIASDKRVRDTFYDMYNNDEKFRKLFNSRVYDNQLAYKDDKDFKKIAEKITKGEAISQRELKGKGYDLFNQMMIESTPKGRYNTEQFYKAMAKQGINAIQDVNDKKYSGYNAKNPLILLDGEYSYAKKAMTDEQIKDMAGKAAVELMKPIYIKAGASFAAKTAIDKVNWDNKAYLYRKEHPNTTMTDKEIIKMLKKEAKNK